MAKHEHKYGLVMVGQRDGKTVIVAPYVEGRADEGDIAFAVPKGDAKSGDRARDQNTEFYEETGINPELLALSPNDPRRGKQYGAATVLARFQNAPVTVRTYGDNTATLHTDTIVVGAIGDIIPAFKGQRLGAEGFQSAEAIAQQQGLPPKQSLLAFLHAHGLPPEVADESVFRHYIAIPEHRKAMQPALDALRAELEQKGVVGDEKGIKLDNKIKPLGYFQEGAMLVEPEAYMAAVRSYGKKYPGYAATMLGDGVLQGQTDAVTAGVAAAETLLGRVKSEGSGRVARP